MRTVNKNKIKETREDRILNIFIKVILAIIALGAAYPLYLVLICSISDPSAISTGKVFLVPRGLNVEAYKTLLDTKEIWVGYRNSILYTVIGTTLQMIVTTAAAFAVSRKNLPGRRFFSVFFIFTMYFSGGIIPTYLVIQQFHMINTPLALIIPGLFGPYNFIICRNYFENSIPEEIFESAAMDGAGMIRTFLSLAVPLAKPVLAVMVLNFALGHWNSYMNAMLYINDDSLQTLQVIIKRITTAATSNLDTSSGVISAAEVISTIRQTQLLKYAVVVVSSVPMIIMYPFISKHFVKGIMLGSVKE